MGDVDYGVYRADATYYEGDRFIVEDFKGAVTPDGEFKLKLMKSCHGIIVRLVDAKGRYWSVFHDPRPKRSRRRKAPKALTG